MIVIQKIQATSGQEVKISGQDKNWEIKFHANVFKIGSEGKKISPKRSNLIQKTEKHDLESNLKVADIFEEEIPVKIGRTSKSTSQSVSAASNLVKFLQGQRRSKI